MLCIYSTLPLVPLLTIILVVCHYQLSKFGFTVGKTFVYNFLLEVVLKGKKNYFFLWIVENFCFKYPFLFK